MKWFGPSWGAPVCDSEERVEVPVGQRCPRCCKPIEPEAQGLVLAEANLDFVSYERAWHLDCLLAAVGIPEDKSKKPRQPFG
jgi:hypothetical protein